MDVRKVIQSGTVDDFRQAVSEIVNDPHLNHPIANQASADRIAFLVTILTLDGKDPELNEALPELTRIAYHLGYQDAQSDL